MTTLSFLPQGWSSQSVCSWIGRGADHTANGVLVSGLEALVTCALSVDVKMVGGLSAPPGVVYRPGWMPNWK
ncbi:hypothetical protein ACFQ0M_45830 [Kitasatospora aburaviensis]